MTAKEKRQFTDGLICRLGQLAGELTRQAEAEDPGSTCSYYRWQAEGVRAAIRVIQAAAGGNRASTASPGRRGPPG